MSWNCATCLLEELKDIKRSHGRPPTRILQFNWWSLSLPSLSSAPNWSLSAWRGPWLLSSSSSSGLLVIASEIAPASSEYEEIQSLFSSLLKWLRDAFS
ncbi:hypothetical protein SCLCIDRAFT_1219031 [Scleroderma citrinum Foug A]|uniref:Uncharacterized protein n=1 Tax=Scleroderma citrinum Foug A TaxID=1036808 RepID=A0A0C3DPN2_9AGAM|nr:hypothetical protein SCLCIDRAFT_1219031 [Scleroderma citrinum Foug A]